MSSALLHYLKSNALFHYFNTLQDSSMIQFI